MIRPALVPPLLVLLLAAACGGELGSELASRRDALAVSGPWSAPASTREVAAHQYVDVVDPPAVSPDGYCSSSNPFACSCVHPACSPAHPGTVELDRFLRARFPYLSSGGLFCCRQNSATTSVPRLSVHAIGRAIDLMVPMSSGDADNGLGDPVVNWLVENAEFIGVQRIVWDKAYWNGERGFGLLGSSSSPHTNHIHLELSRAGAAMQTPFFTTGAHTGACAARCEGGLLLGADCGATRCADYGTECVGGASPRCGEPPPPEPPEAAHHAGAALPSVRPQGARGRVTLLPPTRLFDSRTSSASRDLLRADGSQSGPLKPGANTWAPSASLLPGGATAAWLNLAAVPGESPGFLTGAPAGERQPATSSLNFAPGRVRSNALPVVLGAGSGVSFHTGTEVHLVGDLGAVFTPDGDGLTLTGPTRVLDTRASDAPLLDGEVREVDVRAPANATGVFASLALIGGDAPGHVVAFPCGGSQPSTSSVNFAAGSVSAHTVVSGLGGGKLCVRAHNSAHLIVDVAGFLSPGGELAYQPLALVRLLDTRAAGALYSGRLGARQVIELPLQSLAGMPEGAWGAALNLTTVGADGPGHLTTFPCGGSVPNTSSLNFGAGDATAALTVSSLGQSGRLCVFASSRTHLIADLVGVWVHDERAAPPPPSPEPDPADGGDAPEEPEAPLPPDPEEPGDPAVPTAPGIPDPSGDPSAPGEPGAPRQGEAIGGCSTTTGSPSGAALLLLLLLLPEAHRRARRGTPEA
ncbi:MAG: hypothetical protein P1V51_00505 [Deltaproteobacteria bacterium]|nr:hypothetical protein [Deltaproteobacteria bacterium]